MFKSALWAVLSDRPGSRLSEATKVPVPTKSITRLDTKNELLRGQD